MRLTPGNVFARQLQKRAATSQEGAAAQTGKRQGMPGVDFARGCLATALSGLCLVLFLRSFPVAAVAAAPWRLGVHSLMEASAADMRPRALAELSSENLVIHVCDPRSVATSSSYGKANRLPSRLPEELHPRALADNSKEYLVVHVRAPGAGSFVSGSDTTTGHTKAYRTSSRIHVGVSPCIDGPH